MNRRKIVAPSRKVAKARARTTRARAALILLVSSLISAPAAWADFWIVMTNAEIGANDPLDKNTCTLSSPGLHQCPTLREAINATASGDEVMFDPSLDGATINLTRYTNCLAASQAKGPTCLPLSAWPNIPGSSPATPYVSQFGASAFFISGKLITINASQKPDLSPMKHGVVIARDPNAPNFRLFDIDGSNDGQGNATSVLILNGITLNGGVAQGGDAASSTAGGAFGAGGAIFNRGSLQVYQGAFIANAAIGGAQGSTGNSSGGGGVGQSSDASGNGGGPNGGSNAVGAGGFGGGGAAVPGGGVGGFGGGGASGYGGGFGGGAGNGGNGGFGGGSGGTTSAGGGGGGAMGGAIFNDGGTVSLIETTLTANSVTGGANHSGNGQGGSAYGGAIFNYNGSLKINGATLVGNAVTAGTSNTPGLGGKIAAGAIYSLGDSPAGCAVGGNASCAGSGATLAMDNSIAAKNINASYDIVVNLRNTGTSTASGANNFIGGLSGTLGLTQINSAVVTDPQLGMLAAQLTGGMTDALVPQPGSPVIDAISCASSAFYDQRNVIRPQGSKCDIGAVEVRQNIHVSLNVYGIATGAATAVNPPSPASGGIVNCSPSGGPACSATYTNSESSPFDRPLSFNVVTNGLHISTASAGGCYIDNFGDHAATLLTGPIQQDCGFTMTLAWNIATTTVVSSGSPSVVGDPVTFTATIEAGQGANYAPSGAVTFYDGSNAICTGAAISSAGPTTGTATCTVSNLALGAHTIAAQYGGDSNYILAQQPESAPITQQVVKPTLTVTANDQTKVYGQALTFAGTEFTATGLRNNDTVTLVTLASAGAIASAPVAGSPYTITVPNITGGTYNPANYNIVFVTGKLTVTAAAQSLTFSAPARAVVGNALPFSVTSATPNSGSPVTVISATPAVCTLATTSSTAAGAAGTVTALTAGTCTIVASQAADAAGNYTAASAQAAFTVYPPPAPAPILSWQMLILLTAAFACAGAARVRLPKTASSAR